MRKFLCATLLAMGAVTALAAPASAEVSTFTGSGLGTSPSQAVDGAVRMAYAVARSAGWSADLCHVRATDVRSVGGGVHAASASLFCRR
ncbi:hypothetical protein [Saccharothrix australiensis]|uniref:Uncharacterized protein n=1 Tax=Saccharothrix australiensis TaxID=2072 RepID=A0A495W0F5_9PSEU|nr:hypothetical protein [Saccharothrix australiensis]RKT54590.1 hypothetical protein C8E97_3235 [Saccharothrix australiensis]